MNILEKLESCKDSLTPKELEIYDIFLKDPYSFSASSSMEIARRYHVAQSAISRFCQKAGFSGFADFRLSTARELSYDLPDSDGSSIQNHTGNDRANVLCEIINRVSQSLPDDLLDSLAQRVLHSTHIYTSGYGCSYCAAQSFAFLLTITSIPSNVLLPSQEMEALHIIRETDMVFLFSYSNPSHQDFLSLVTDLAPEKRPYIVLVTCIPNHPLRNQVSQVVQLSSQVQASPLYVNNFVPQFAFYQLLLGRINHISMKKT